MHLLNISIIHYQQPRIKQHFVSNTLNLKNNSTDFCTNETLSYNSLFTYVELYNALKTMKFSTSDRNLTHIEMIIHLNLRSEVGILKLYNIMWTSNISDKWRKAHFIPLLKSEKNRLNTTSYRPISITNSLCKLMEKMVNNQLLDLIDSQNSYDLIQFEFRTKRSTTNLLIHWYKQTRNNFENNPFNMKKYLKDCEGIKY